MSMEDVLNSFWDDRLHEPPKNPSINDLVGKRIPFWAARTPDGKSEILSVRPYTGCYGNFFDCVVLLKARRSSGEWYEIEMTYNSQDYRE